MRAAAALIVAAALAAGCTQMSRMMEGGGKSATETVTLTGSNEASTTRMPCAVASSAIDFRLSWIASGVVGPVLPAMSFVPASITTTFGLSSITSRRKRISICGVVCPLMPRLM